MFFENENIFSFVVLQKFIVDIFSIPDSTFNVCSLCIIENGKLVTLYSNDLTTI
jgi:hypothetical protein